MRPWNVLFSVKRRAVCAYIITHKHDTCMIQWYRYIIVLYLIELLPYVWVYLFSHWSSYLFIFWGLACTPVICMFVCNWWWLFHWGWKSRKWEVLDRIGFALPTLLGSTSRNSVSLRCVFLEYCPYQSGMRLLTRCGCIFTQQKVAMFFGRGQQTSTNFLLLKKMWVWLL